MPKYLLRECWDSEEQVTKLSGLGLLSNLRKCHWSCEHLEMPLRPGDTFGHWAQRGRHARKFLVSFGTRLVGSQGPIWGRGCRGKKVN